MRMNRLTRSLGSLLLGCAVWALPIAASAEYPDKPIRLIVPQAAGSATDTVARILAAELGPQLGVVGQRFPGPRRRRIVQVHDRHANPARAVPRRGGRYERPDRGSCRSDV